jgi:hypothetical protein
MRPVFKLVENKFVELAVVAKELVEVEFVLVLLPLMVRLPLIVEEA